MARLTFDQLFRYSEPKRIVRSADVKGPPLDIDSYRDAVYYIFNFKSNVTNTTGLRHRGYVKFFRPRSRTPVPLHKLECLVDCECPDYRYRWAWANKQRRSGAVGPQSLNQAWNRAPRITNPRAIPGLCKHILAMREYIYGLLSSFPSDEPDTSVKFDKLLKHATKRWADFPGTMAAAKQAQAQYRARAALRNIAGAVPAAAAPVPAPPQEEPGAPAQPPEPPELPPELELAVPAPPLAIPPGERGLGFPPLGQRPEPKPPAKPKKGSKAAKEPLRSPTEPSPQKGKVASLGYPTVAQMRAARYGESQRVFITNGETNMSDLNQALRIVEELTDEAPSTFLDAGGGADAGDYAAPDLPPSEPPTSDTALGADTEGESALALLRQMRDSLQQLATALAPPPEEGAMGGDPLGGGGAGGAALAGLPGEGGEEGLGGEGDIEGAGDFPVPEPSGEFGGEEEGEEGGEKEGSEEGEGAADDDDEDDEGGNKRPVE